MTVKGETPDKQLNRSFRSAGCGNACPGFYNMPEAADGHLCRIKLPLGAITLKQLARIADLAEKYGSGNIELTTRGSIQIRGIKSVFQENLSNALTETGLAPLARCGDNIRNVMVNPTAGLDIRGSRSAAELAGELLAETQRNPLYQKLSPKFSFYIDGRETCFIPNHDNDIWVSLLPSHTGNGASCCIGLASPLPGSENDKRANILGIAPADCCLSAVCAILDCFIEAAVKNSVLRRMKDWLAACGLEAVRRHMRKHFPDLHPASPETGAYFALRRKTVLAETQCIDVNLAMKKLALGIHKCGEQGQYYFGAAPELGRFSTPSLRQFVKIVEQFLPQTSVRTTARQTLIFSPCAREDAEQAKNAFDEAGFITGADNPRAHLLCCAGAPFCAKGRANIQKDAAYLANALRNSELMNSSGIIHLTGCPKSCAAAEPEYFTLLALDNETYAVYHNSSHKEGEESHFGHLLAPSLRLKEIIPFLERQI